MTSKSAEHLKRTWERQPDLSKPDSTPPRAPQAADNAFDPLQHGTHQESNHNKPERAHKGAQKH
jgi:hypothetical protein